MDGLEAGLGEVERSAHVGGEDGEGVEAVQTGRPRRVETVRGPRDTAALSREGRVGLRTVPGDNLTEVVDVVLASSHLQHSIRPAGSVPLKWRIHIFYLKDMGVVTL